MFNQFGHQDLLDALPMASVILDDDGTIIAVNRRWKTFSEENGGDTRDFYVGYDYLGVCRAAAGESSAEAAVAGEGIRKVIDGAPEFRCEYPCHSATQVRWFELIAGPLVTAGRRLTLVSHFNITSRRLQQDEVARSQINANELAALVACSTDAIMSYDMEGRILTWNKAAADLYGYTADEAIGQSMEMIYPEDWPVRITEYRDRIISGEMRRFDVIRRTKSGEYRNIAISASPVRGVDGEVVAISNFHRDVTEQKATEEHLAFVTRELRHRTKNMFAIISAIERQTARKTKTIGEFHETFASRLNSLASANDLLISKAWRPVSLDELCRSQLSLFTGAQAEQVRVEGPPVSLDAAAVEAVGLSLHELATNALKYGALTEPDGRIALTWDVVGEEAGRCLSLVWHERASTITAGPRKNGFGHFVVTANAEQKTGGAVLLEFGEGELTWKVEIPGKRITPAG